MTGHTPRSDPNRSGLFHEHVPFVQNEQRRGFVDHGTREARLASLRFPLVLGLDGDDLSVIELPVAQLEE
jgi:hypothetical protein